MARVHARSFQLELSEALANVRARPASEQQVFSAMSSAAQDQQQGAEPAMPVAPGGIDREVGERATPTPAHRKPEGMGQSFYEQLAADGTPQELIDFMAAEWTRSSPALPAYCDSVSQIPKLLVDEVPATENQRKYRAPWPIFGRQRRP